ncbi:uncharacterized protein LOC135348907 isoform X2 [Halichondria panicea]|uniref:uncharacterized protein LOC135348907 isoform X2 n=1 Tax=Halichondria panicea TaxID=6063 RepID=UPI00312BB57F
MSFVKVLARRVLESNVRKLEQPDIWKLYHLVHFYKGFGIKGDQTFGDIPDQKTPLKEQYRIVHKHVQQQVQDSLIVYNHDGTVGSTTGSIAVQPRPCTENMKIPGVLVEAGHILPGAFVCFFPGKIYVPSQLREIPGYPDITHDNHYLMARTDGSIIDAKDHISSEGNPLAVGHLIRHPPNGTSPNVMPFSFDISAGFPIDLLPLVPNIYHRKPGFLFSSRRVLLRTIVFVATEHIRKGEELFLNYRLHPESTVPDWYSRVDGNTDNRSKVYQGLEVLKGLDDQSAIKISSRSTF